MDTAFPRAFRRKSSSAGLHVGGWCGGVSATRIGAVTMDDCSCLTQFCTTGA